MHSREKIAQLIAITAKLHIMLYSNHMFAVLLIWNVVCNNNSSINCHYPIMIYLIFSILCIASN